MCVSVGWGGGVVAGGGVDRFVCVWGGGGWRVLCEQTVGSFAVPPVLIPAAAQAVKGWTHKTKGGGGRLCRKCHCVLLGTQG
jgi:hypothetical protein